MEKNRELVEESVSISFTDILIIARTQIVWILLIIFASVLVGVGYIAFYKETTYTATAKLFVDAKIENSSGVINETSSAQWSTYLAPSCEDAMTNKKVFQLLENTDLPISKGNLKFKYSDSTQYYAPYFDITYTYSVHGGDAERIKVQVASTLNDYINKAIYYVNNNDDDNTPVPLKNSIKISSSATEGGVAVSSGRSTVIIIAFVIGLVLSAALVLFKYFVNDTVNDREDIERITGLMTVALVDISPNEIENLKVKAILESELESEGD